MITIVIGVARINILAELKYSAPKMMIFSKMEKGTIVHNMIDLSLVVYRGSPNIVILANYHLLGRISDAHLPDWQNPVMNCANGCLNCIPCK